MFIRCIFIFLFFLCWDVYAINKYEAEQQLGFKQILCNDCTSYNSFESAALASASRSGVLVVSNMVTGGQKAFEFVSEQEPGYVLTYVNEVSVPNVAQAALSQYRAALTSLVAASGGSYLNFRTPNVPVIIPNSINGISTASASSVLSDVAALSAVSNLIRLQLVGDLGNLTSLAKAVLMSLQKIAVTVKFSDGSSMSFIAGYIWESVMPFKYVEGSARDASGRVISTSVGGGGGESYAFSGGSFSGISGSCELWSFPDGSGGRYIMEMNCNYFANP